MRKMYKILLLLAVLIAPWATRAQNLGDYYFSTGTDTTKWVDMSSATQILAPTGSDGLASSLQNIGFAFPFSGDTLTQFSVNTDGNLRLGSTATGTGSYSNPFSSTAAGTNGPKINPFGCDGYGNSGSHYVKSLLVDDTMLVVEFCMGTYTTTTRDQLYKWQIHLYASGNIEMVFPSEDNLPNVNPAVAYQCGLCVNANDGVIINSVSHTAMHFTNGSTEINSSGTWYDAGRYYSFVRPSVVCPRLTAIQTDSIGADYIAISWEQAAEETSWQVYLNGIMVDQTNTTDYTFTNLTANTVYNLGVASVCDIDFVSNPTSISVRSGCGLLTELPMIENFESQPTGSSASSSPFIPCWERLNNGTSYAGYPYVSSSSTYNHTTGGTKGLYWYGSTTTGTYGDYQIIVLPGVDTNYLPINTTQLSFWAKSSSTSYHPVFYVGVMTDPTNDSTFTPYDTIAVNPGSSTEWTKFTTYFNNYEGYGSYVAIKAVRPSSLWYAYVDDIILDSIPSCIEPLNFTALATTQADSIVVGWSEYEDANGWELVAGPTGCAPDTIADIVTTNETSYTFTTLTSGISYDIYVRANCSDGNSRWSGPVTVVPGMYIFGTSGSDTIYACSAALFDDGGPTGSYSNNADFTLVVYPSTPDSLVSFSGTAYTEGSIDYLRIYDGVGASGSILWQTSSSSVSEQIPTTLSTSGPITLVWHTDGSVIYSGFEVYTTCTEAPSCFPVTNIEVSNIAATSAYVRWSAPTMSDPTEYEVEVYQGSQLLNTLQVTGTSTFVSGLVSGAMHKVLVRSVCEDNSVSPADSISFATNCLGGGDVAIENTLSSNSFYPVNTNMAYSYTQTIYNASYFNGASDLRGIAYKVNTTNAATRQISIYMGETTQNTFHANSSVVPQNTILDSNLTLVYSGSYNPTPSGWKDIMFDSAFHYSGAGNLVVAFYDHTGSAAGSTNHWTRSGGDTISVHYHNASPIDLSNPVATTQRATSVMPDITFYFACDSSIDCVGPNVMVSSISSDEVGLMWAPGFNETSWEVAHREADSTLWVVDDANVTTTNFTVTGLNTNVEYVFRVTADCDEEACTYVSATTACAALAVPFAEDFETFSTATTSPLPNCWYKNTNYTTSYPYASTGYSHSGTRSMYMYSTSSTWSYMVLPMFEPAIDSLMVSFWLYKNNTSYSHNVLVGVMSDPTDASTFTQVASVAPSTMSVWEPFEVPLSSYTGTGRYIAIMSPDGAYSYPYLDDLSVEYISSCPRVSGVAATSVSQTTATIVWDTTSATGYEVQYGPAGFDLGTGLVETSSEDSITLTGLTPNTIYNVYVRGNCGDENGNWSFSYSFRTLCSMIDVLPYTQDFESEPTGSSTTSSPFIPCWTRLNNGTSSGGYPYLSSSTSYNHTVGGTKGLYWYGSTTTGSYGDYQYIVLPQIDTTVYPLNMLQLTFWAKPSSTSYSPVFEVGVMNSVTDTAFTRISTININNTTTDWVEYITELGPYTGTGASFVAIRALRPTSSWYAYVDDITLELTPLCPKVVDIAASTVLTQSATITWTDTSSTNTAWYLEYSENEIVPGTGVVTPILVNDTFYTITGLDSGVVYHVYIYPDCDSNVYYRHYTFTTLAASPSTVPYYCDFEADGVNGWDLLNANQGNYWVVDSATSNGGSRSMYITDNGSTNTYSGNTSIAFATRTFNLTTAGEYLYSYDWKCQGESSFDFIRAALVPAGTQFTPGDYSGFDNTSAMPAGAIAIDGGGRLNQQSAWTTQSGTFQIAQPGTYTMVFMWRNDGSVYNNPAGAIDNIFLMQNTCPAPSNLHSTAATTSSIDIDWTDVGNASTSWIVEYGEEGFGHGDGTIINVTSHPITLTNLDAATGYDIYVRPLCGLGDTGVWVKVNVWTALCDAIFEYANGAGTSTGYTVPVNNFYNFTLTQTIIDSAELADSGFVAGSVIKAVAYSYAYSEPSSNKDDVDIWIQHTNKTVFTDISSIDTLRSDAVLAYSGNLNCVTGWNYFNFQDTVQFVWDGQSNIMIIVDDNSGSYDGSTSTFDHTSCTGAKSITYYSDSYNPDIYNLDAFSGTRTTNTFRPTMKLLSCNDACSKPSGLNVTNISYSSVSVNWAGNAADYEVAIKSTGEGIWPAETTVNGNSYTFNGLQPNTDYQIRVRAICDAEEEVVSDWAVSNIFTTAELPCFAPTALACGETSLSSATLSWTAGTNETEWNVHVWNSGFDSVYHANNSTFTVTGLTQTTTYNVAVSALCGGGVMESEYSDTITVTTQTCPTPGTPAPSSVTANSAVINWTGSAANYVIEYGMGAFGEGQGTTVEVSGTSYTISGLEPETQYTALVRAKCDNVNLSGWSERAVFTTEPEDIGIDAVNGMNVNIYPNPTSGNTTITLSGFNGEVSIAIVDLNGRTVRSEAMTCEGDCAHQLEVSDLASGAYFVRISGEGINTVKKLIVK